MARKLKKLESGNVNGLLLFNSPTLQLSNLVCYTTSGSRSRSGPPRAIPGAWSSHTLFDSAGGAPRGLRRWMKGAEADNHREGSPVPVVTMKQLLEAGVHFGHQTRRWNPKMARYIFTERNGIHIIDLQKSVPMIETAYQFIRGAVANGGTCLFVGTKKQAQDAIREEAMRAQQPYVCQRWLGGMLTNFQTIRRRVERLREIEDMRDRGHLDVLPKREQARLLEELARLEKYLGGIKNMTQLPAAVYIVDTRKEHIGVAEARKLGIPVVAIVDTNCDPDEVDYPIPGNDDAIRAVRLITSRVANAALEGLEERRKREVVEEGPTAVPEEVPAVEGEGPAAVEMAQTEELVEVKTPVEEALVEGEAER